MKFVMFYHSLISDWNHGNAHFLRGIVTELLARGHQVSIYEPHDAWSMRNLLAEHGPEPLHKFHAVYPGLTSQRYDASRLNLEEALEAADVVLVHEWNEPALVKAIGRHRAHHSRYRLFFHDTHHRLVSAPETMSRFELGDYDGVLAYGATLRERYERNDRVARAWTWHEAADTRIFRPLPRQDLEGDLVWIGNWGDGERSVELEEFLVRPCQRLKLKARVYGVRYPEPAKALLSTAGIHYAGWLPNFEVPQVFAAYKATVHIPRRPYVQTLPGIPTIRPFEALACGIPLICSPWDDTEGLFRPGLDFLIAHDEHEMARQLRKVLLDEGLRRELAAHGLKTIRSRHTCAHRVNELLAITSRLRGKPEEPEPGVLSTTATPVGGHR
jgi:spore maturation protein CgeB